LKESEKKMPQDFKPKYINGYPTEETAPPIFEECKYQAAAQLYILGYAYLNSLGWEKGCAEMGGNERSIYHKKLQRGMSGPTKVEEEQHEFSTDHRSCP
jgi:hypothetical protein